MAETPTRNGNSRPAEWLAATARAMVFSLLAVVTSVIVVTSAFVALQTENLRSREYTSVTQCLISQDGQRAVALWWNVPTTLQGWTHRVSVQSLATEQTARTIDWPEIAPSCVAAGATDNELFVAGWDGAIYAIRGDALDAEPELIGRHTDSVVDIEASADGRYVISLSPTAMCAWDVAKRELIWQRSGGQIICFGIHPDSSWLACGLNDGRVVWHDMQNGCVVRELLESAPSWPVHDLDFTADGRLLSIAHATGEVRILATDNEAVLPVARSEPFCSTGWPRLARFSTCGTMLATTADGDKPEIVIWNVASGQRTRTLSGHTGIVLGVEFTRDGRLFSWGNDATIRIWDVERGETLNVLSLGSPHEVPRWLRPLASLGFDAPAPNTQRSAGSRAG